MQLAQAIDAWGQAHLASLSVSTQRDIGAIRAAVVSVGWDELPCTDVDKGVRREIVDAAIENCSLSERAIDEFLSVVLRWTREFAPPEPIEDGLGPRGAFRQPSPEDDEVGRDDDPDDIAWIDEGDDAADDDADDDEDEPDDEIDWDLAGDLGEDDDRDGDDRHDDDWVGYLAGSDDGEDAVRILPENEPDLTPADKAAASSFFDAIGSSPAVGDADAIVVLDAGPEAAPDTPPPAPAGGVFSAASEGAGAPSRKSIDWITVAYFTVAAICFALVIYFYLSS